jgi:hypothetical protein
MTYIVIKMNNSMIKKMMTICKMCEARFRKSLEMSHDTEETSSKRKFRKYDTAIDTSCAFETIQSSSLNAYAFLTKV